ncbi:barstar family protein [Streptomyces sp. NPDC048650]|uniref:barstar family protein n=1 Tax=Streptomyces sp. NPDC048650 TaxID=3365583 RepID=UPI00371B2077
MALRHHACRNLPDSPAGSTFTLDGRYIVDEDSFYCALGEAVNGPGGYFGWNLDALDDCLRGRWGAASPFALDWQHSETAATYLSKSSTEAANSPTTFDRILEVLQESRIDVLLR